MRRNKKMKKSNGIVRHDNFDSIMLCAIIITLSLTMVVAIAINFSEPAKKDNEVETSEETETIVEYQDLPLYIKTESGEYINVEDMEYLKIEDGHIVIDTN